MASQIRLIGIALVAVVIVAAPARAQECETPEQALAGLVIPADGATGVPTNVTPFVGGGGALELLLRGDDGAEIPSQIEVIAVGNALGGQATIKRVVSAGVLNPGQNVTVVADGAAVTHFTVGDSVDSAAPGAPDATLAGDCSRGGASITVGVANDDAVLFVGVIDGVPAIGGATRLDGASKGGPLVLFGTGSAHVNVAGVDLAGNVGAATPVDVKFPKLPDAFGCSCAAPSSRALPWSGCVLVLGAVLVSGRPRPARVRERRRS